MRQLGEWEEKRRERECWGSIANAGFAGIRVEVPAESRSFSRREGRYQACSSVQEPHLISTSAFTVDRVQVSPSIELVLLAILTLRVLDASALSAITLTPTSSNSSPSSSPLPTPSYRWLTTPASCPSSSPRPRRAPTFDSSFPPSTFSTPVAALTTTSSPPTSSSRRRTLPSSSTSASHSSTPRLPSTGSSPDCLGGLLST